MDYKKFLFSIVTSLVCFSQASAAVSSAETSYREEKTPPKETETCGKLPIGTQRIEVRHIESKGIGYKDGYTTLEGFFTVPNTIEGSWLPFLDVRGHVFNDGKMAANAGLGIRYMTSWVWGMNAYYDYRNTSRQHYNQFSMGLEALGKLVDLRINGYLPLGEKDSNYFDAKAKGFSGNNLILTKKQDFAMKGANAEVGFHFGNFKNVSMYSAAGPYYFEGKGKVAWGGEGRFAVDLYNYVRLQVNGSYDKIFKGIVQGEVSVMIPFGKRKEIKRRSSYTCPQEIVVKERALQRVDRNEIIVVDRRKTNSPAIDPLTGNPFVFLFVDNTSHSLGTFESPYNTLLTAQQASNANDIIYVFPGDGTTTGMDQGFTMKDNQKLWGAGIDQSLMTTFGEITVPAQASSFPLITAIAKKGSSQGIVLANSCEVSGLNIINTQTAIQNLADKFERNPKIITNTLIQNNIITDASNYISLTGVEGEIIIKNNTLTSSASNTDDSGIVLGYSNTPRVETTVSIINNQITLSPSPNFSGIDIDFSPPSGTLNVLIQDNVVTSGYQAIFIGNDNGSGNGNINGSIIGNTCSQSQNYGLSVYIESGDQNQIQLEIDGNNFTENFLAGLGVRSQSGNILIGLKNNTSLNNRGAGYAFFADRGSIEVINLADINDTNIGTVKNEGATSKAVLE